MGAVLVLSNIFRVPDLNLRTSTEINAAIGPQIGHLPIQQQLKITKLVFRSAENAVAIIDDLAAGNPPVLSEISVCFALATVSFGFCQITERTGINMLPATPTRQILAVEQWRKAGGWRWQVLSQRRRRKQQQESQYNRGKKLR